MPSPQKKPPSTPLPTLIFCTEGEVVVADSCCKPQTESLCLASPGLPGCTGKNLPAWRRAVGLILLVRLLAEEMETHLAFLPVGNPMDWGAWKSKVQVAKIWIGLSWLYAFTTCLSSIASFYSFHIAYFSFLKWIFSSKLSYFYP